MSPKLVLGLAFATAVAVVAAVATVVTEPATGRIELDAEPAFPALRADPDAVDEIAIKTAGQQVVLRRMDDGAWAVESAHGYPASTARVREIVTGLADMRLIEPKTANPDRFERLELEDVENEGAASRLVRLTDADGDPLAEVLVGKPRHRVTGTEPAGTYIRRPDEQQAWLASGRIELPEEPALWLERRIVDLATDAVVRIDVEPPEEAAYALVRDDDERWRLEGEDVELAGEADPIELAGALDGLDLRGVRPADRVDWPDAAWRVRFTTDDGLEVSLRLVEIEGAPWARFEASTRHDDADAGAVERATALSERTEGWAYRLPDGIAQQLRRPRSAWLDDSTS